MNAAPSADHSVSYRTPAGTTAQHAPLGWVLGLLASLWVASDAGYYLLLPLLGFKASYNANPTIVAVYYGLWIVVALITLRGLYRTWWVTYENRPTTYVLISLAFATLILFPGYALPLLPPINWVEPWHPPEVVFATPWYFLPKSIEILFQQLLIAAMVTALSAQQYRPWTISLVCGVAFGGTHILVAVDDVPVAYVIRLMSAGAVFGLVLPHFILRMRNGLAYAYLAHWCYYAATVLMAHAFYTPNLATGAGS
jgi:hypothetical protein